MRDPRGDGRSGPPARQNQNPARRQTGSRLRAAARPEVRQNEVGDEGRRVGDSRHQDSEKRGGQRSPAEDGGLLGRCAVAGDNESRRVQTIGLQSSEIGTYSE